MRLCNISRCLTRRSAVFSAEIVMLLRSRTPRRAATRIALHACAVAYQREVAAFAAHLAFVAFGLGFGATLRLGGGGGSGGSGLAPLQRFQLFRRRQVVLGFLLQRDGAFEGVGDARA